MTEHDLYVDYYESQINPFSCYDFCSYYDDIYGYNYLGVQGTSFPDDVSWFAPGGDTPVPSHMVLEGYIQRSRTVNGCQFPSDETNTLYWWGTNHRYAAGFFMTLQGSGNYNNPQR